MRKIFVSLTLMLTIILLSCGESKHKQEKQSAKIKIVQEFDDRAAITKHHADQKIIHLIFSADTRFDGAETVLNTLKENDSKGSFFLTGNCLRKKEFKFTIDRIIDEGHYLGGHSDNHLLYASWENRDSMLVTEDSLRQDFQANMTAITAFDIDTATVKYFLAPFEHHNKRTVELVLSQGQQSIHMTAGIRTAADYSTPDMKNYVSSEELIRQLYQFEGEKGLNGAIILIHPGIHPDRTDKLYNRLDEIIKHLKKLGYQFDRF